MSCLNGKKIIHPDMVNSPSHYKLGGTDAITILKTILTGSEYKGFLKGNALKYILRAGKKNDESQDFNKSIWYLKKIIEEIEAA